MYVMIHICMLYIENRIGGNNTIAKELWISHEIHKSRSFSYEHFIVCHMPTWTFCTNSCIFGLVGQQICLNRILWIFCVEIVERTINEYLARFWNHSLPLAAICEPDDLYMRFKMSASERRLRLKWGFRLPFVSLKIGNFHYFRESISSVFFFFKLIFIGHNFLIRQFSQWTTVWVPWPVSNFMKNEFSNPFTFNENPSGQ